MTRPPVHRQRCAVYTRKSTEEGLEMEFNSLDAQRESCEAYVVSQRAEGWTLVPDYYDDGGVSGGTLDRPALKRLLADIENGLVDVVVVYKIDRLSRSLLDFARLVEVFDRHNVTFVSVTQSFNTTTSMGRLTLNVLLSFAQFEREVIGERIRDKFAASRKRGMWMGGPVPYGYDIKDRKLIINPAEAENLRWIFNRYTQLGSVTMIVRELMDRGITTKSGRVMDKSYLYRLLSNRIYLGEAVYKGTSYPGEHKPIIDQALWGRVHAITAVPSAVRSNRARRKTDALLKGLLFGPDGRAMSPTHTRKNGKLYRYYSSQVDIKLGAGNAAMARVSAGEIEGAVVEQVRHALREPKIVVAAWREGRREMPALTEAEIRESLIHLDPLWDELFPAEQTRIVQLLIARIDMAEDKVMIRMRTDGLSSLAGELGALTQRARAAA